MEGLQTVWGWQPALYLFLGGMGAGAFLAAGILYLADKDSNRKTVCFSMWAAFCCLALGLLLLLLELTNPLRGMLLWQSFSNGSSWMTFGAWAALCALAVFAASALLLTSKIDKAIRQKRPAFAEKKHRVVAVLAAIGIVLAVCVAVYTGMLLMSVPGVPLWNTLLLPCLFTVSAFDTGVALVEAISVAVEKKEPLTHGANRFLEGSVVVLVVLEGIILFFFAQTMLSGNVTDALSLGSSAETAAASMQMLVSGQLAPYFWVLLVACGLAVPLIAAVFALVSNKKRSRAIVAIGAAGAIVGGCALRFLVLMAGLHADQIADAVSTLLL